MDPLSPPPTRSYPSVYEAWRRSHRHPEPEVRRRDRSVDRQVIANLYQVQNQPAQVSNQPSCSSGWSDSVSTIRSNDDVTRNRAVIERPADETNNHSINRDDDVLLPVYSTTSNEDNFLESVLQVLNDLKLINPDQSPALNVIPEFDPVAKGQTIDSWIQKVELCRNIFDWSERMTTYYASLKLSGMAMIWYQSLPTMILSWEELKENLREAFPATQNYAELLTEMLSFKSGVGESLELYYYEKINLLHRCNISGKEAVDCLIYGVQDKAIMLAALVGQFTEPHHLLKFFKSVK